MEILPIHYYELDVGEYNGFFFTMPEHNAGRNNILIFVEYAENAENSKETIYHAWGQRVDRPAMRCLVSNGVIPTEILNNDPVQAIITILNESDKFFDEVKRFGEWAERNFK